MSHFGGDQDVSGTTTNHGSSEVMKSLVVWFTGLSGAGKSTLAAALSRELRRCGAYVMLLDGDQLRLGLNSDLGFTDRDRTENIRRVAEVAKLVSDEGLIVIASLISPFSVDRELARKIVGTERFLEIYVSTPIEICESRDPKGLYKKARSGQILNFTGIGSRYEPPNAPNFSIDTSSTKIDEAVAILTEFVLSKSYQH
jgi:adenylyl-sulfate kinase